MSSPLAVDGRVLGRDDDRRGGEPGPLWATVLGDLRVRLRRGEFDERFPTDRELMARYGVSRHTVREAVRRLDRVDRRPRVGGRIRRPASALENLGAALRALGVDLTLVPAGRRARRSAPIAAALRTAPARRLEVVDHVLRADGQPLLVSELWLGPGSPLGGDAVEWLLGLRPAEPRVALADESVLPVLAPPEARSALGLADGAAVFCAEHRVDVDGVPAGWHRAFIRPERYRCIVRWDPATGGA
jgi:GntR family transcriptional regulator